MRKVVILGAVLGVLAAMGLAFTVSAATGKQTVPVYKFNTTEVVPFAGANLTRTDTSVSTFMYSVGIEPNHAYTAWWVVFNNPSACVGGCGLDDVLATVGENANDNPADIGVFYASGKYANAIGAVGLGGTLREGDTSNCVPVGDGPFSVLCNPLIDAENAEIHVVVRDHGPMVPGQIAAQLGSFTGGCSVNTCVNVQSAIFNP